MFLQEGVEVVPELGHPVQHPQEVLVGQAPRLLCLHQLPVQVAHQEAVSRLHVVGEGHHPGRKAVRRQTTNVSVFSDSEEV